MATPLSQDATLSRSTSGKAPLSPFNSNTSHHLSTFDDSMPSSFLPPTASLTIHNSLVSNNTTAPSHSKMVQQPATPGGKAKASYFSLWSPRRLMQRASHAFRSSKSRRKKKKTKEGDCSASVTSWGSDVFSESETASIQSLDEHLYRELSEPKCIQQERHKSVEHLHSDVERIIWEEVETVKETIHEEVVAMLAEEPKKFLAPPIVVVEEAILIKEATNSLDDTMTTPLKEVRFQGSKVKTTIERRSEREQPKRKEVMKSNDVIEETRSKLLEKRHSKVKALVGAFETVMDTKYDAKPLWKEASNN